MKKTTSLLSAVFLFTTSFFAFAAQPAKPAGGEKLPHGTMKMSFELSPAGDFEAESQAIYGYVEKKQGKIIPPKSVIVQMDYFKTKIALRDKHMREKMHTDKYPRATLSDIKVKGNDTAVGKINFHGVTKDVVFDYSMEDTKAIAKFKLKISDFAITEGIKYMGVGVEDEVECVVELPVIKR